MSTQQDIYAAGSENRPPMLNKDNYVPWSSHILCYAKSKPNGKLLVKSIKNVPYVRRIIHEPGDPNSVPRVAESTHEQTDDELTKKEVKQIEADDQAIQTILIVSKFPINLDQLLDLEALTSFSNTIDFEDQQLIFQMLTNLL
ncbi:hypothetical protein Tco_0386660 [Tanacetum coccineum]